MLLNIVFNYYQGKTMNKIIYYNAFIIVLNTYIAPTMSGTAKSFTHIISSDSHSNPKR